MPPYKMTTNRYRSSSRIHEESKSYEEISNDILNDNIEWLSILSSYQHHDNDRKVIVKESKKNDFAELGDRDESEDKKVIARKTARRHKELADEEEEEEEEIRGASRRRKRAGEMRWKGGIA